MPEEFRLALAFNLTLTLTLLLWDGHVTPASGQSCASVTSFNTGLTPVVAKVDRRIPTIQAALRNEQADVLCLQEVWYEKSVKDLSEDLEDTYPYHYSKLHVGVGQLKASTSPSTQSSFQWLQLFQTKAPCSTKEVSYVLTTLVACAVKYECVGNSLSAIGGCLARKCKAELKSKELSQSCLSCALFSVTSLATTLNQCARIVGQDNRFNGPGLVLLSRKKILNVRYVNYFPFNKLWVERGYIEANIQDVGKVVCTHLSANMDTYLEFDTYFRNYQQQQSAEIRRLTRLWFSDHILMGDLNTGPSMTFRNISANFGTNYNRLMSLGYKNPYMKKVGLCTYCSANPYTKEDKNMIIDHVLLKGNGYRGVVSKRVLATYGNRVLSDHLGVRTQFCNLNLKYQRRSARI